MFENISIAWLIPFIVLFIIYLVFYIFTLVHQFKRKHYAFFVLSLIFNISIWIYWIVWLSDKSFRRKR
jgi:hypothetical protein